MNLRCYPGSLRSGAPIGLQEIHAEELRGHPKGCEQVRWWLSPDDIRVCTSVDGGHLHASISHPSRYPTWDEIRAVRDWYFPEEMEVVMVLARRSEYVNLHPNCFHLWQSRCGEEGR